MIDGILWLHGSRPYGLNDVQGWGLVVKMGGGGGVICERAEKWRGQTPRAALHTRNIRLQNSFCESHTWRLKS